MSAIEVPTLRGIVRMAALVVMSEVDETDKALATAIAIKASLDLRDYMAATVERVVVERLAAIEELADGYGHAGQIEVANAITEALHARKEEAA